MFKSFAATILSILFCHISVSGQTFDSSKSLAIRKQILASFSNEKAPQFTSFKIKLSTARQRIDVLETMGTSTIKSTPTIKQLQKSAGGESAGGGQLIELKIAASVQKMFEALQKKNPDGLNLETLQFFIENTTIKISSEKSEFYLQRDKNSQERELRDAVNFFPEQWLLKLYTPAWEKYYALNMDVEDLLYHEFLLFFFKNDKKYSRSKFLELGNSRASILTLVIGHVKLTTPDIRIQIEGRTIDQRESIVIDCSFPADDKKVTTFSYYRQGKFLASTQNASVNPFCPL